MIENKSGLMAFFALIFIASAVRAGAQASTGTAAGEVSSGTAAAQAAAAASGAPTLAVQDLVASARVYKDVNAAGLTPEEKSARLKVKNKLSGILDLHEMAHLILVKHWDKLTPAQREKYAALLAGLVEKVAYPQIEKYFNEDLAINYAGEKALPGGGTGVQTKIVYKEEDLTLSTDFLLRPTDKGWRIYDVVTDGESLLLIYRNQHMSIIKDKGFPELVKLMEKKLNAD